MFSSNLSLGQKKIEGLFYLDRTPISIEITEGKISNIKRIKNLQEENKGIYIAPGLIDNQVNGFSGVSFSFGGSNLTLERVVKVTRELWKKGVTTFLPTLTTNSQAGLIENLRMLHGMADEETRGSIQGFHLEGSYINPENGFRGAHPKQFVTLPDWEEFKELYEVSKKKDFR